LENLEARDKYFYLFDCHPNRNGLIAIDEGIGACFIKIK
jgi:hypothetical protein